MARYDDYNERPTGARQKDLVLNMNEYAHLLSRTDGNIKCAVGPYQTSLSQQETPVIFNTKTKRFEECDDYEKAKQLFVSAPEGWYIVLKNPAKENGHPEAGRQNQTPTTIEIGRKINISGPTSFALFPGQMAKVVRGHRLRSNQYLLARVYDAEAAKANTKAATMVDTEGNAIATTTEYFVGQLLVIKGTEVSFYMPPTGIEVIPIGGEGDEYVRDAVTLERLEYAILKDEDGEKRYIHGPAVVFPKPTEIFVQAPKGGNIFRALELSPISGIYVKVIAAYDDTTTDEKGEKKIIHHPIGEELFITGKDQMIYYPRPEHALIQYDGKYMHHAIAIPEGEGRYILNRLTGEIKTIKGPSMYLPDPRTEVVVKRKLTKKECSLYYPGNTEVAAYNEQLTEQSVVRSLKAKNDVINTAYLSAVQEARLAIFEANANISRGTSYTKPRTITLDTKFDGAVSIDVWNGYAINVISKRGTKRLVIGPATTLLDYDETLESVNPETLNETVFLKTDGDSFNVTAGTRTKDNIDFAVEATFSFSFINTATEKWFSQKDYKTRLVEFCRKKINEEIRKHPILEICDGAIFENIFNGVIYNDYISIDEARINSCQVGTISVAKMISENRDSLVESSLNAAYSEAEIVVKKRIAEAEKTIKENQIAVDEYITQLRHENEMSRLARYEEEAAKCHEINQSNKQAEADMQKLIDSVEAAKLAREKKEAEQNAEFETKKAEIEKTKQNAYADAVAKIMTAITPDLVAAMTSKANADLFTTAAESIAPYALAGGDESVADVANKLMRGTSVEGILGQIIKNK